MCILTTGALGDWIYLDYDEKGNQYFYENMRIRKIYNSTFVWVRIKYDRPRTSGRSEQSYFKINCQDYSLQIIQRGYYVDKNWKKLRKTEVQDGNFLYITPNSIHEKLADTLCKNTNP